MNEALRIVKDGIADRETVNKVYRLATNAPFGILDVAEMIGFDSISKVLEDAYSKTGLEIYKK